MNRDVEERVSWSAASTKCTRPSKDIRLDSSQAERWLGFLEQLAPSAEHARTVTQFCDQLDDALWLARWKREYVIVELPLEVVPCLIAAIAGCEANLASDRSWKIQEDLLAALSKMSGWT